VYKIIFLIEQKRSVDRIYHPIVHLHIYMDGSKI